MIELKSKEDIEKLRIANKHVGEILNLLKEYVKPGVSAYELDQIAYEECKKRNVKPAFLGLYGFPASLCVSINEEVVHGIPKKEKVIKEGDIVSLDFGVEYEGWFGDAAITVAVGEVSERKKRLIEGVERSLEEAIKLCYPSRNLKEIASVIQKTLLDYKLTPVCTYGGHGIGRKPHEPPHVTNCVENAENVVLKEGMVLAIEPMAYLGKGKIRVLKDGWTVVTTDKSQAAHFEHSIAVTENGPIVLSKLD